MAGWQVGGLRRALMESDEEFQEDEVWAVMDSSNGGSSSSSKQKSRKNGGSGSVMRRFSSPRSIPRGGAGQSAPVDSSDWSKVIKKKAKKYPSSSVDDDSDDDHGHVGGDVDDDDDGEMVPPHEILARRFAKTQIASHSMCEGVGRTLKGRDLSKLRNAILTKTGFLE